MKRAIFIRPRAEEDIREAKSWYEKRSIGLGGQFILELDRALEGLATGPIEYRYII